MLARSHPKLPVKHSRGVRILLDNRLTLAVESIPALRRRYKPMAWAEAKLGWNLATLLNQRGTEFRLFPPPKQREHREPGHKYLQHGEKPDARERIAQKPRDVKYNGLAGWSQFRLCFYWPRCPMRKLWDQSVLRPFSAPNFSVTC
jgi:hypothetical protein